MYHEKQKRRFCDRMVTGIFGMAAEMERGAMEKNEKKQKKKRRAYLDDFKKNDSGDYVYEGAMYAFCERDESRKKMLAKVCGLCGALVFTAVVNGFLPVPGLQNSAFVLLPFAVELIASISCCVAVGRIILNGKALREYVYQATVMKLPGRSAIALFGAGAALFGELLYLAQDFSQARSVYVLIFFVLQLASFGSALYLHRESKAQRWEKI